MPAPGELRAARLTVAIHDHIWEKFYAAPARLVQNLARRLNRFQFLTIRSYLVFMFSALIVLLLVAVVWF